MSKLMNIGTNKIKKDHYLVSIDRNDEQTIISLEGNEYCYNLYFEGVLSLKTIYEGWLLEYYNFDVSDLPEDKLSGTLYEIFDGEFIAKSPFEKNEGKHFLLTTINFFVEIRAEKLPVITEM